MEGGCGASALAGRSDGSGCNLGDWAAPSISRVGDDVAATGGHSGQIVLGSDSVLRRAVCPPGTGPRPGSARPVRAPAERGCRNRGGPTPARDQHEGPGTEAAGQGFCGVVLVDHRLDPPVAVASGNDGDPAPPAATRKERRRQDEWRPGPQRSPPARPPAPPVWRKTTGPGRRPARASATRAAMALAVNVGSRRRPSAPAASRAAASPSAERRP